MDFLLSFFAGSPARIASAGLGIALVLVGGYALWLRAEVHDVRAERDLARAQIAVLSSAVETCNSSIDHAKRAADAAVKGTTALLAEAKRLKAPARHTVERIERIIREPMTQEQAEDCRWAWGVIEREAKP